MGDTAGDIQISRGGGMNILKMSSHTEFLQSFIRVGDGEESGSESGEKERKERKGEERRRDREERRREREERETPPPAKTTSFQQIKKEIVHKAKLERQKMMKDKKKKGPKRQEETYTDKDRAAAVNMGSRDIKHSLKVKRRQDRSKALQISDEAEPSTLLALGNYELRSGHVDIAVGFVNKALELCSTDKNALVARSKCYLLLGEPNLALNDAETALAGEKTFVKGILQKAEALYHLGDFEHALVFYHRGLRIRPEMQEFRLGVQKSREAIENTIGNKVGSRLTVPPGLELMSPGSAMGGGNRGSSAGGGSRASTGVRVDELAAVAGSSKRADRLLLGGLNVDKEYLEQLLKHPDIKCMHKGMAANPIEQFAQEGVAFIKNRQEFWRQQRCEGAATKRRKPTKKTAKPSPPVSGKCS